MSRPVKDIWNWYSLEVPYSGDWRTSISAEKYLREKISKDNFEIRAETGYPGGKRRYGSHKVINKYIYYLRNPKDFTLFALKYS